MKEAPLFSEIAQGPDDGAAWWMTTADGVRIRVGLWNRGAPKGTVFLFPGRTEYIEKYGVAAAHLADCGYATLVIDWRGQGLADRLQDDVMSGHVHHFTDYQMDVAAMVEAAHRLDLPRPWQLLAHSMGGCIGLRAVMQGMEVQSCAFSGPMWGIAMADALRPVAWSLSWSSRQLGMSHFYAPGSAPQSYVLTEPFETNKLTNDREMYQYMINQANAHPELGIGGPSLHWLHEALSETRALARRPSPDMPCLTLLGSDEQIVDVARIRDRMAHWPGGHLEMVETGRHETLMDSPEMRGRLFRMLCEFYSGSGDSDASGPARQASVARQAPKS
jgi:lysophospholipase